MARKLPKSKGKKGATMDAGSAGQSATDQESPELEAPEDEMHSAKNAPHKMSVHEMYPPANIKGNLMPEIEAHMKQAAAHAGRGEHHRTMREHHEGMARALRAQLHPKHSPEHY